MTELRQRLARDGLFAGGLAYLVVAAFFVLLNVATGRPALYTAALLGEGLFAGLRDPAAVAMDAGLVIAFNGVQLVILLLFGFFAAWLAYETELHPEAWYLAVGVFVMATVAGYAGLLVVTLLLGGLVSAWLALAASLLAAAAVALYFVASHRTLAQAIREEVSAPPFVHHGG